MKNFKINIFFKPEKGSRGGGSQFLRALKRNFIEKDIYEKNPSNARCILYNSHHNVQDILKLKLKYPLKTFIHRIDGPLGLIRGSSFKIDKLIYELNNFIADGTIFQSNWCKNMNYSIGFKKTNIETVIMNAADDSIFYKEKEREIEDNKWKLISISWSSNINKGFDLYKYLDENLDFEKYSMIFVGNSPIKFRNIKQIRLLDSNKIADLLRASNIYITGSKNDPCSNSLIEALSCGLPCIALNDGGHPEILKQGGETFNTFEECLKKIQYVKENYSNYKNKLAVPNIDVIANQYIRFMRKVYDLKSSNKYKNRKLKLIDYYRIIFKSFFFKTSNVKSIIIKEFQRILNKN
ncbi:MAG: glycosyltransferase [Promethearchaeota archaeon]